MNQNVSPLDKLELSGAFLAYRRWGTYLRDMPIFIIERRFAEELELSSEAVDQINRINDDEDVSWMYSFLSADKRKTYCLYEASSEEAIKRAAVRAGLPADVIVEVTGMVRPDGSLDAIS
jgi:hypothetical protein